MAVTGRVKGAAEWNVHIRGIDDFLPPVTLSANTGWAEVCELLDHRLFGTAVLAHDVPTRATVVWPAEEPEDSATHHAVADVFVDHPPNSFAPEGS